MFAAVDVAVATMIIAGTTILLWLAPRRRKLPVAVRQRATGSIATCRELTICGALLISK